MIDQAFRNEGVAPDIVLTAIDADLSKTYVQPGMLVGIVPGIAYETERDTQLPALDARSLFGINLTKLAVPRGSNLRSYVHAFIKTFAPRLTREVVQQATATSPRPDD